MKRNYIVASIQSFLDYYMVIDGNTKEVIDTKPLAKALLSHLEHDGYEVVEDKGEDESN